MNRIKAEEYQDLEFSPKRSFLVVKAKEVTIDRSGERKVVNGEKRVRIIKAWEGSSGFFYLLLENGLAITLTPKMEVEVDG